MVIITFEYFYLLLDISGKCVQIYVQKFEFSRDSKTILLAHFHARKIAIAFLLRFRKYLSLNKTYR